MTFVRMTTWSYVIMIFIRYDTEVCKLCVLCVMLCVSCMAEKNRTIKNSIFANSYSNFSLKSYQIMQY